ncbi:MAG: RNA polymerase sigma factor [Peptococcaceae bacterium]|nr:RNA polymerase sigma factor [Peptococcaceae bacterium]
MEYDIGFVRQILLGRRDLFELIVLEYQNLVFTVCLNIVKNKSDAENMAQETFLTAYRSLSDFRGGNFKSWLCRIAVNKSIDCRRRQSRFVVEELRDSVEQDGDSVEEVFERKERGEKLEHILAALPDRYTAVVRAFYYSQLPVKEIARRMELPERTVETRLYRAKKLIRERWGEDGS